MNKYSVEVLYQTFNGNEAVKKKVVEATSHSIALNALTEKVRKYKRCLKILGGNCVEVENNCQHSSNEDCMNCSVCGKCSESLDEDDVCSDCGGKDMNEGEQ